MNLEGMTNHRTIKQVINLILTPCGMGLMVKALFNRVVTNTAVSPLRFNPLFDGGNVTIFWN